MKLENLKLSEVIKLIEDKPDEILKINALNEKVEGQWDDLSGFVVLPTYWIGNNFLWTVELKPMKKELTRDDLAQAWDIEGVVIKNAKPANESKFFKAICERLGI